MGRPKLSDGCVRARRGTLTLLAAPARMSACVHACVCVCVSAGVLVVPCVSLCVRVCGNRRQYDRCANLVRSNREAVRRLDGPAAAERRRVRATRRMLLPVEAQLERAVQHLRQTWYVGQMV